MRSLILVVIGLLSMLSCVFTQQPIEVGSTFPLDKIHKSPDNVDNTIVVFMPSLSGSCDYASMLTQSFYYYFAQQLAFEKLDKKPTVQVVLVVENDYNKIALKAFQNNRLVVVYDTNHSLAKLADVPKYTTFNEDATLFLLDKNHKVAFIDKAYRAQGEHLKPLEHAVRKLNNIPIAVAQNEFKTLKVGDVAPDFDLGNHQKLSDLKGEIVLLSFYPAAFSGTLPPLSPKIQVDEIEQEMDKFAMMTCAIQIQRLDAPRFPNNNAITNSHYKTITISESTPSLLTEWAKVLKTSHIIYANDADYRISKQYQSYNPNGYNNRVSVIVDAQGIIQYIQKEFDNNTITLLTTKIDELYAAQHKSDFQLIQNQLDKVQMSLNTIKN